MAIIILGAAGAGLGAAVAGFAAGAEAQRPAPSNGTTISIITGGMVDAAEDIPGSFAPSAGETAECPKPSVNAGATPSMANTEMIITDTWRRPSGDVEGISHMTPTKDGNLRNSDSGREFFSDDDTEGRPALSSRTLCAVDLADSQTYVTLFGDGFPETLPGTTRFSLSSATLHLLRTTGEAPLTYIQYEFMTPPNKWVPFEYSGVLLRVEPADVPTALIIDGKPASVPTLHAKGVFEFSGPETLREMMSPDKIKQLGEFYVLDDEAKPISVLFKFGPIFQVQVVSITYPKSAPQNQIERQLRSDRRAVVYGIYFDFNSDRLRAESRPVLQEIADAMTHNPDWHLTIDGHTDNIGGDVKNLDLSRRRAEAVRRALVEQYHLSIARMVTSGYGASRPVDSNDTLTGRARNRRVELTRQ